MAGACRLPPEWNGCANNTDFCFAGGGPYSRKARTPEGEFIKFNLNHHFDEVVSDADAKVVDARTEGVLNHLQYRRLHMYASKGALDKEGEYTASFFNPVYEALDRRGLAMLIELPDRGSKPFPLCDSTWADIIDINTKIESAMNSRAAGAVWLDPTNMKSILSEISLDDILYLNHSRSPNEDKSAKGNKLNSKSEKSSTEYQLDDSELSSLPAFSTDYSEMFLASMIEREDDSYDLHLTTFLMCHSLIKPDKTNRSALKIRDDKETLLSWSRAIVAFKGVRYLPSGAREITPRYFCKIKHSDSSPSYTVQGT